MTFQKIILGIKLFALTGCLVFTTTAFSQGAKTNDQPDYSRAKLLYKQTHGLDSLKGEKLFADGFKLKMDISFWLIRRRGIEYTLPLFTAMIY